MPAIFLKASVRHGLVAITIGLMAWSVDGQVSALTGFAVGPGVIAMAAGIGFALFTGYNFVGVQPIISIVLPAAIICLGFGLDLSLFTESEVGIAGLGAITATLIATVTLTWLVGRALRLGTSVIVALGAGAAICGNTAVLAIAPLLQMKPDRLAVVLAAINVLGLAMFVVVVIVTRTVGFSQDLAGIGAGASIHAVPQAIAAGDAVGAGAGTTATAVKLSRVGLLVLLLPLVAGLQRKRAAVQDREVSLFKSVRSYVPVYLPCFVLAVLAGNLSLVDASFASDMHSIGRILLIPVLAAVGMRITRESVRKTGGPVFLTGSLVTIGLATASLAAAILLLG